VGIADYMIHLIAAYGYLAVGLIIALAELAALYATRHGHSIKASWRPPRRVPCSVTMEAIRLAASSVTVPGRDHRPQTRKMVACEFAHCGRKGKATCLQRD
jgi:hypothetical protein